MTSSKNTNKKGINIKVRSEVLEYSLSIEDAINSLLLAYLGIADKSDTKLFGNKAGISFKSKIDLLYDINVISKKEHSDLELQMIFRNKFIHMLQCNSFLVVLSQLDNGIKNKFKKHMSTPSEIDSEDACRKSYKNIYVKNLNITLEKFELKIKSVEDKRNLISSLLEKKIKITNIYFNFIGGLLEDTEDIILKNTENDDVIKIAMHIASKCEKHSESFSKDTALNKLNKNISTLLEQSKICEYIK